MNDVDKNSLSKAKSLLGLQLLSDFGDQITLALIAMSVLDISKSTGKVGLVYFLSTFGFVVFTLAGGVLGDKISRKNILVFCDIGRGIVVLLMIVAFVKKSLLLIYGTSFLLSVLGSLQRPARLSSWTEIIPSNYLERYNSLSELSIHASTIAGPLVASFFVMKEWISWGFAIDALTFFLCAASFFLIISDHQDQREALINKKRNLLQGFKFIAQHHDLRRYVAYDAIQMVGFGAFNATFLVLAQRDFGWSKLQFSYHLSIIAIFCTLSAFLAATRLVEKIDANLKLVFCACASAGVLLPMLLIETFPLCSLLFGFCNSMAVLTVTVTRTRVQRLAKNFYPNSLASIIASRSVVIRVATIFGIGSCLLIDDFLSLKTTLLIFVLPIGLSCMPLFIGDVTKKTVSPT